MPYGDQSYVTYGNAVRVRVWGKADEYLCKCTSLSLRGWSGPAVTPQAQDLTVHESAHRASQLSNQSTLLLTKFTRPRRATRCTAAPAVTPGGQGRQLTDTMMSRRQPGTRQRAVQTGPRCAPSQRKARAAGRGAERALVVRTFTHAKGCATLGSLGQTPRACGQLSACGLRREAPRAAADLAAKRSSGARRTGAGRLTARDLYIMDLQMYSTY